MKKLEILPSKIGNLPSYSFHVSPSTITHEVMKELKSKHDLPGALIIESGELKNMISRERLFSAMSHPYGVALFMHRPITSLLETSPSDHTCLPSEATVEQTVKLTLSCI